MHRPKQVGSRVLWDRAQVDLFRALPEREANQESDEDILARLGWYSHPVKGFKSSRDRHGAMRCYHRTTARRST